VIEDAGLTFPENDVSALHRALEKLVQDKALRRTLGVRGRARVLEHFTQHQVAEATVNIYQELTT
jgi:rhamnosyl/mannosyltransferase